MPLSSKQEKAFCKLPLVNQFDEIIRAYKILAEGGCEKEMLQLAKHFEDCRKRWNDSELKCVELQKILTKCEADKDALIIKLKHARRQIEVEIQTRHQVEQQRDELAEQMALVRELLLSDFSPSNNLTEEQQKKLDFLNASRFRSPRARARTNRRLDPIDETGSMLSDYSDISFDVTEDDLDCSHLRNGKKWKRSRVHIERLKDEDETLPKKVRADIGPNESLRCTVDGPATMHIEKLEKSFSKPNPHQGRRRPSREHLRKSASSESEVQSEVEGFWPSAPRASARALSKAKHNLQPKPCVITKETCKPCGKRIQFGKKALKCADCRLVSHVECESKMKNYPCDDGTPSSPSSKSSIENFLVSDKSPQIPSIIYHTVQEIERRGLTEVGLYRVPGMIRVVKELKEKFNSKTVPKLSADAVPDIHALCSLVKDFLRVTLSEPIVSFELRPKFIEASLRNNEDALCDAVNKLKPCNRDTLMFLMLHFQRVVNSDETRMTVEALAKAVGPSVVGYENADPSMQELQRAPRYQELMMTKLLQLPSDFYAKGLERAQHRDGVAPRSDLFGKSTPEQNRPASMLGPIGSPSRKTPSSSSLAERAKKYLGGTPFGKSRSKETAYFASPSLH